MNSIFITSGSVQKLDLSWKSSVGDFNGDGKTDILWHNETTGENTAWLMDGTTVSTAAFLPATDVAKQPKVGDYNGDGKTDVFWRNYNSGENSIWTVNGTTTSETPLDTISPEWIAY